MKSRVCLLVVATTLTLAGSVFADDPPPPAHAADAPLPSTATSAQPAAVAATATTSTTTVTSADADPTAATSTATTLPPTHMREADTITLNQSVRPNKRYLFTGAALFLGSYVPTAVLTAANPHSERVDKTLYLPVAGPWLNLADRDCKSCTAGTKTFDTVLIAGSGVIQGAGLVLMAASLFVPESVPAATIQAGNVKMNLTATSVGRDTATFGAVGTF